MTVISELNFRIVIDLVDREREQKKKTDKTKRKKKVIQILNY